MTQVVAVENRAGFWHWMCSACGSGSRRWFHTREEALEAGRWHADTHEVNLGVTSRLP
jgi:hypothetical protein